MIPQVDKITQRQAIDYEIRSSWWAKLIWWEWGQDLAASYFANKANRKYNRYLQSKADEKFVKENYHVETTN